MKQSELKSFIKENIIDILSEVSDEELENLEDYSKELDDVIDKQKELGKLQKEEEEDDKDAVKAAMKARGKFKKLDLAVKGLKDLETEMKSLARKYGAADEDGKNRIKDILKKKTSEKNELKSIVAKLEKNVV
jgi:hypothetical protein